VTLLPRHFVLDPEVPHHLRFRHGDGQSELSRDPKLVDRKRVRADFLIERVQRWPERKERRDALNDLPEPSALIIREFPVAAIGLPVSKPLLQYGVPPSS
jgi:hypothetical protein